MRFVPELMDLMGAHPGRDWRMMELVRYCCPAPKDQRERSAVHRAVHRAVEAFVGTGTVIKRPPRANGGYGTYRWIKP